MRTSAEILEYEPLRQLLGRYVSSPMGRRELEKVEPHTDSARLTEDFTQPLIKAAVEVTRNFQGPEIEKAMNYLIKGRDNPAVVKRTDFVLTHFAEYVRRT